MYKSVPPDICLNLFFASSEMIPVVYCPLVLAIGKHQWFRSASSLLGLKDHIPLGQTGCYHHVPVQGGGEQKTQDVHVEPTTNQSRYESRLYLLLTDGCRSWESCSGGGLSRTGTECRRTPGNTACWMLCCCPLQRTNQCAGDGKCRVSMDLWRVKQKLLYFLKGSVLKKKREKKHTLYWCSVYLLVGFECCGLCGCEAVGQKSREAKQQTEDIQANQDDDLCNIATKFNTMAQIYI